MYFCNKYPLVSVKKTYLISYLKHKNIVFCRHSAHAQKQTNIH
jgi:hypothetical protein